MSSLTAPVFDPEVCDEFGYGLGRTDGILVLRYRGRDAVDFAESRQDFLHQLYWSPDGVMSVTHRRSAEFVDAGEALWVHRAVTHAASVRSTGPAAPLTIYRVCLREVPGGLAGLRIGATAVTTQLADLFRSLAQSNLAETTALQTRTKVMAGLGVAVRDFNDSAPAAGHGFALRVARAISAEPADPTRLDEWAGRLHISPKTLQRDFARQFGQSFSAWRAGLRLRASLALLGTHSVSEVAHRVGYSSPSAYIAAFTRAYGQTPGKLSAAAVTTAAST